MSGTQWQERALALVTSDMRLEETLEPGDYLALLDLATSREPYEPYYTLKGLIVELERYDP